MWHEARKQERKIRGMLVDYRKRAERRRDFYEKIKADPTQFLQVHGRQCKIHLDPAIAAAAEGPATMMPWQGQTDTLIDRFDVRAHLDFIPPVKTDDDEDASYEERQINYERYRIIAQNSFLTITEEKFLKQLHLEEQFGYTEHEPKKKKVGGAAIGFNYEDGASAGQSVQPAPIAPDEENSDDNSDSDLDVDLSINVSKLDQMQAHEMNRHGRNFGMSSNDFYSFLTHDLEEAESFRLAKEEEHEKALFSGRKSRRERRAHREKRLANRKISPPSYAAIESPTLKLDMHEKSESRSPSPENTGKITFITSFGGEEEPQMPAKPTYADKVKFGTRLKKLREASEERFVFREASAYKRSASRERVVFRKRSRDSGRVDRSKTGYKRMRSRRSTSSSSSSRSRSRSRSRRNRRSNSRSRWGRVRRRSRSRSVSQQNRSRTNRSVSRSKRSISRSKRSVSRSKRSVSRSKRSVSRSKRSVSRIKRSVSRSKRSNSSSKRSNSSSKKIRSSARRSNSRSKRSSSKARSASRGRRSVSRTRQNRSNSQTRPSKSNSRSKSPSKSRSASASSKSSSASRSKSRSKSLSKSRSRSPSTSGSSSPSVPKSTESPPKPIPRYYGRRKSDQSSSELSESSEDGEDSNQINTTNLLTQSTNTNSKTGNSGSSTKSLPLPPMGPSLSLQERLKRKRQALLNKQFKADKIAEQIKTDREKHEQQTREDELREMALKLRRKQRERRHAYDSDSSESSGSNSETKANVSTCEPKRSKSPSPQPRENRDREYRSREQETKYSEPEYKRPRYGSGGNRDERGDRYRSSNSRYEENREEDRDRYYRDDRRRDYGRDNRRDRDTGRSLVDY